ncbi:MAG: hypothetical protein GVY31_05750 [Alphaproteobacteria bacterium]|jgi:hypothetical protein|nr:hypothetical protein [Alphaproteobacteria bacterium]
MTRIALVANYLGGSILALGMLCLGLSMPRPGWKALSEQLPNWLFSVENGSIAVVLGVLMIAAGKASNWGAGTAKTSQTGARASSSPAIPRVWVMDDVGSMDVFAAYCGPDEGAEARKKYISSSGKNRLGWQLQASDFPRVLYAMEGSPPAIPQDYCFISGRYPMVSPRLAELLKTLDLGNGDFFEAEFYTEDGSERLPWSHSFWNIGNKKDSFLPEKSNVTRINATPRKNRILLETYATEIGVQNDDIAVGPEALDGPDVWKESKLSDCILFSDRFVQLMQENGMLHLFDLKSVRLILPD